MSPPYSRVGGSGSYGDRVCTIEVHVMGPHHRFLEVKSALGRIPLKLSNFDNHTVHTKSTEYDGDNESNDSDTAQSDKIINKRALSQYLTLTLTLMLLD